MGQVSVVKIFPELLMLLEVDKNGLPATFAVSQELNPRHVHRPFLTSGQQYSATVSAAL
jgi:hypothetical protein